MKLPQVHNLYESVWNKNQEDLVSLFSIPLLHVMVSMQSLWNVSAASVSFGVIGRRHAYRLFVRSQVFQVGSFLLVSDLCLISGGTYF